MHRETRPIAAVLDFLPATHPVHAADGLPARVTVHTADGTPCDGAGCQCGHEPTRTVPSRGWHITDDLPCVPGCRLSHCPHGWHPSVLGVNLGCWGRRVLAIVGIR